ncbi:MAG: pyruvate carboxylase subunit B [Oscillospiraceae bacterium]|nr:pyruvate carboxylase subunit B [Oscillospiraceae bacterium]
MNKKVQFTETVLRDAQQSLIATRLRYDQFAPILEKIDQAGYYSVECWGGATFDVCLRYLNEDPWERLRKIKAALPHTKLQMLLRGQNILGYKHYPDDVVRRFVRASVRNGIDIIRIFDALNDTDNLKVAIEETVKCGAIASGAISYTTSPVHTLDKFVQQAKEMQAMGASTICIKDMAGIMTPKNAYDLVAALKDAVDLPVVVHTHSTPGMAFMTYIKAVEAGADVIDTAISAFSGGTSQPSTETLDYALREMGYDTGLNSTVLHEIDDYFKPIKADFIADGTLNPISLSTDAQCLCYQIPGGMLSNLLSQMKMMNALDKYEQVLIETPLVREDLGYPPLVTPTSQLVGTQAVQNVLAGERYKNVGAEVRAYCRGEYGRTPAPINPEVQAKILKGEEPIKGRYADSLPTDTFEKAQETLGDIARCEEDVLSYISFPEVAEKFFAQRKADEEKVVKYSVEAI